MTRNGKLFATGRHSLAEAYTRTVSSSGDKSWCSGGGAATSPVYANRQYPFLNVLHGARMSDPKASFHSRCWYVFSLDEILGGEPDHAKQLLQQAGINYFLFSKDFRLRDLLPHSKLFAPDNIADYLGVKWSNGSTYLLTWRGPDTKPIGAEFLEDYKQRLDRPEESWFLFGKLAQQIIGLSPALRSEKASATLGAIPWRQAPNGTVDIISATYGQNCSTSFWRRPPSFRPSNATRAVRDVCQGLKQCHLTVDVQRFPEAPRRCGDDFTLEYRCKPDDPPKTVFLSKADGQPIDLECGKP